MTKRVISVLLSAFIILFSTIPFSGASNADVSVETIDLGDGFTVKITTNVDYNSQNGRATNQTASSTKTAEFIYQRQTVGTFTLYGKFSYNGSSSSAVDHDWVAKTIPGYSYDGDSYTSGSSAYGSCTFTGNGISKTVSLKITCDKNGNIS